MSLRVADLVSSLSSTDGRAVAAACESLYRNVLAEGFNRFQTVNGHTNTGAIKGGTGGANSNEQCRLAH